MCPCECVLTFLAERYETIMSWNFSVAVGIYMPVSIVLGLTVIVMDVSTTPSADMR